MFKKLNVTLTSTNINYYKNVHEPFEFIVTVTVPKYDGTSSLRLIRLSVFFNSS